MRWHTISWGGIAVLHLVAAEVPAAAAQGQASLPQCFGSTFAMPAGGKDEHGNLVVRRNGGLLAPGTGHPHEIWLKEPRMEFVLIPPGDFMMGEDRNRQARPAHRVQITRAFYMAKYEITQSQWQSVMLKRPWSGKDRVRESARSPAVHISWDDCQAFLDKLNARTGPGFRLPTEAEWAYACRAGSETAYCFGEDLDRLTEYEQLQGIQRRRMHRFVPAHAAGAETVPHCPRSSGEIMQRVGKAVTDAVLCGRGVNEAMKALGMSKDVWYRVRRDG